MSMKSCLDCKEQMNTEARKCPHCHSYQRKIDRFFGPQGFGRYSSSIVFIFLAFAIYFSGVFDYDPIYNPKSDLAITESAFQFDESRCRSGGQRVSLIGTITNRTKVAYQRIVISVTYYDESNDPINVVHDEIHDLIVPPESSQKFRASGCYSQDKALYVRAEAKVTKAEPDGWL